MLECKPEFEVVEVARDWVLRPEEMGSREKFWYRDPEHSEPSWLFKYPRPNTGEHWAEKIAAEAARELEIPHARVELALFENERGSVTESFVYAGQGLIHGNQVLAIVLADYDAERKFNQSSHTLKNMWHVMDQVFVESDAQKTAKSKLAEYMVLDALIGNTDRHHENWGLVVQYNMDTLEVVVASSFDHASSLGRELRDKKRESILATNRVGKYAERGRGAVYWSEKDPKGPSPLELVRCASRVYPELFLPAIAKLHRLDNSPVTALVNRIPLTWMTPPAKRFATALMAYNLEQLKRLLQ